MNFLGGIIWVDFFGSNFMGEIFWGGIFWEKFFLGGFFRRNSFFTLLRSAKLFEYGI